jgi:hypothetical protein
MPENPAVVTVRVPERLTNLEQANKVLANVLGKLGCPACLSGFDIRFTHVREMVVNARDLSVHEIGH